MRLDESDIDLHGFLRALYSCQALGRSFVMDHSIQRPIPSYANFSYGKKDYHLILKEVLNPLGLRLVQGKWVDAIVVAPPAREQVAFPSAPPAPFMGASGGRGDAKATDSLSSDSDTLAVVQDTAKPARRLRAKASGLLKSSARSLGFNYSELLASANREGIRQLWEISALASDSVGKLNFARIIDFSAWDTAHVVFGGEVRRADATFNYQDGTALTQYSSIFDGLTVDVKKDRWFFVWRREGSILEVPGAVDSCASGSSKVSFDSSVGVPFLSSVPFLRYLFGHTRKYEDELLITVCLEVLK